MNLDDFYIWDMSYRDGPLHVDPADDEIDPVGLLRGDVVPSEPVKFVRAEGNRPGDIITCSFVSIWLLSDKVVNLFRSEGITGWRTFPVEVTGKGGVPVTGYHGFTVAGRCGPIDPHRSVPAVLPPLVRGGPLRHERIGVYFDLETWDGSDIFVAPNSNVVMVIQRVKELMEQNHIRGCAFDPLTEVRNYMRVE